MVVDTQSLAANESSIWNVGSSIQSDEHQKLVFVSLNKTVVVVSLDSGPH